MKSLLKKLIPENLHPLRYVNERTLAHFNGISRNDQIDQSQTREAPRRKRTAVAHSGRKAQIKLIDQPFRLLRSFSLLLRKKFQFTMVALRISFHFMCAKISRRCGAKIESILARRTVLCVGARSASTYKNTRC